MRKLPWYKRYPTNAIGGMIGLNPAERGIYNTLIDLCYDRGGPVVDDEKELGRMCGCSTRLYRSVRDALIAKTKVRRLDDGRLIVRGFRAGSDEFRGDFDELSSEFRPSKIDRKSVESEPKSRPDRAKSKASPVYQPSRAPARGQSPESRSQNVRTFKSSRTNPNLDHVRAVCEAIDGSEFYPEGERSNWPGMIDRMIEDDGLTLDDILQAITELREKGRLPDDIRTPSFFRNSAIRVRDRRINAPVELERPKEVSRADWVHRLKRFLECGAWMGPGAYPVELACEAPPDLIEQFRKLWKAQGDHPQFADRDGNFPWAPASSPGMRGIIWPSVTPCEALPPKGAQH